MRLRICTKMKNDKSFGWVNYWMDRLMHEKMLEGSTCD